MRKQGANFKIFAALVCAIFLVCFTCAVFLSFAHDCSGDLCVVCTAVEVFRMTFGAVILWLAVRFASDESFFAHLFEACLAFCAESTPVALKVKLSD